MSIQTALSVGDPVKNLETSELKEFVALIPKITRITPPASSASDAILFIIGFQYGMSYQFLISVGVNPRTPFPHQTRLRAEIKLKNIITTAATRRI
jgi:hypothetical protein